MGDDYADLRGRLDNPPLSWAPQGPEKAGLDPDNCVVAEEVFGQVDEIEERESDFGPYRMVTVVDPDGRRIQIAGLGTVLGKRFAKIAIGDRIAVRYLGTHPSSTPGQADYHDYAFAIDRASSG